jgi:hypothetical protein
MPGMYATLFLAKSDPGDGEAILIYLFGWGLFIVPIISALGFSAWKTWSSIRTDPTPPTDDRGRR